MKKSVTGSRHSKGFSGTDIGLLVTLGFCTFVLVFVVVLCCRKKTSAGKKKAHRRRRTKHNPEEYSKLNSIEKSHDQSNTSESSSGSLANKNGKASPASSSSSSDSCSKLRQGLSILRFIKCRSTEEDDVERGAKTNKSKLLKNKKGRRKEIQREEKQKKMEQKARKENVIDLSKDKESMELPTLPGPVDRSMDSTDTDVKDRSKRAKRNNKCAMSNEECIGKKCKKCKPYRKEDKPTTAILINNDFDQSTHSPLSEKGNKGNDPAKMTTNRQISEDWVMLPDNAGSNAGSPVDAMLPDNAGSNVGSPVDAMLPDNVGSNAGSPVDAMLPDNAGSNAGSPTDMATGDNVIPVTVIHDEPTDHNSQEIIRATRVYDHEMTPETGIEYDSASSCIRSKAMVVVHGPHGASESSQSQFSASIKSDSLAPSVTKIEVKPQEKSTSSLPTGKVSLHRQQSRESVGNVVDVREYALQEWKGNTEKASKIRKGYIEVSEQLGLNSLRNIRGDNYCGIRATLFQALVENVPILSQFHTTIRKIPNLLVSKGCDWIDEWTFGHRIKAEKGVNEKMSECLEELENLVSLSNKMNHKEGRESHILSALNYKQDFEIILMEAVKILMLASAVKLHDLQRSGEDIPIFALIMFARDTSPNPRQLMKNHLNCVGDTGGLEQVEMHLLGYTLGLTIRVVRPSHFGQSDFIASYPEDMPSNAPSVTLVAEDDRHYNILTS